MPGIGIIANPHSKLNKRSPDELQRLKALVGQKGIFTVTRDLQHLDATLRLYRDQKLSILALNGGDGTISQTLSRMIHIYGSQALPQIAVLRGGTMNLIASQLAIKGSPIAVLTRLLHQLEHGDLPKIELLSTMKIGDIYGFLYADQTSTAILEEFYRNKAGHVEATLLSLKLVQSFLRRGPLIRKVVKSQMLKASFRPEGRINQKVLGCFAGTITKLPLGFTLLPLARKTPGHFQTTIVTCQAEKLLWYLPLLMLQQKEGLSFGKHSVSCNYALLQYEEPVHYTVDGEIYHNPTGEVVIETGPQIPFLRI